MNWILQVYGRSLIAVLEHLEMRWQLSALLG